ncbi:unnamed protein product, partial [Effrenium voratum]
ATSRSSRPTGPSAAATSRKWPRPGTRSQRRPPRRTWGTWAPAWAPAGRPSPQKRRARSAGPR